MGSALALSPALRAALGAAVAQDFPGQQTGLWQTFNVVSPQMAAGQTSAPTVSFPVASALYEISGSGSCPAGVPTAGTGGTADLGNIDAFTIQVVFSDQTQLNAGPTQLLGTSFFNRLTGIKLLRKPVVIGPNQNITFNLTNVCGQNLTVYIGVVALQLELPTNAVQF